MAILIKTDISPATAKFPALRVHRYGDLVVLFSSPTEGTAIRPRGFGRSETNWTHIDAEADFWIKEKP